MREQDVQAERRQFGNHVRELTRAWLLEWQGTPAVFPRFNRRFSSSEKMANRRKAGQLLGPAPASLDTYDALEEKEKSRIRRHVRALIVDLIAKEDDPVPRPYLDDSAAMTESFIRDARVFDPAIGEREIQQALRNLWVFNSIQVYCRRPVSLTPSAFAYSLLYPYTDNWLDDGAQSAPEKQELLAWLERRLDGEAGDGLRPGTDHVSRLVGMIEAEYPRAGFPRLYNSLLAIHDAQARSLWLHRRCPRDLPPDHAGVRTSPESDVLDTLSIHGSGAGEDPFAGLGDLSSADRLLSLTIAKGGTSVLADGFLAAGILDDFEANALFGYGVLLQLIDDLHDVGEDGVAGHSTPYTREAACGALDGLANRLFNFAQIVIRRLCTSAAMGEAHLPDFVERSVIVFIMEGIARHRPRYTPHYLEGLDEFVPTGLEFLGDLRGRLVPPRRP